MYWDRLTHLIVLMLLSSDGIQASLISKYLHPADTEYAHPVQLSSKTLEYSVEEYIERLRLDIDLDTLKHSPKEVTLRTYFNNFSQTAIKRRLLKLRQNYLKNRTELRTQKIVLNRYRLLCDAFETRAKLIILKKEAALLTQERKYLRNDLSRIQNIYRIQKNITETERLQRDRDDALLHYQDLLFQIALAMSSHPDIVQKIDHEITERCLPHRTRSIHLIERIKRLKLYYRPRKDLLLQGNRNLIAQKREQLKLLHEEHTATLDHFDLHYKPQKEHTRPLSLALSFSIPIAHDETALLKTKTALQQARLRQSDLRRERAHRLHMLQNRIANRLLRFQNSLAHPRPHPTTIDPLDPTQIDHFFSLRREALDRRLMQIRTLTQLRMDLVEIFFITGTLTREEHDTWLF